jgi:hypothetical protein
MRQPAPTDYRSVGNRSVVVVVALGVALAGCAGTRVASFGPLANGASLVTLVVSEDREVVAYECRKTGVAGTVLGCQMSWLAVADGGSPVRAMKIVRYTDALPSALAFEIDAHELCHAVAALQSLKDPCHDGNDGVALTMEDPQAARTRALKAAIRRGPPPPP